MSADLERTMAETARMLAEINRLNAERQLYEAQQDLSEAQRRRKMGVWADVIPVGLSMLAGAAFLAVSIAVWYLVLR